MRDYDAILASRRWRMLARMLPSRFRDLYGSDVLRAHIDRNHARGGRFWISLAGDVMSTAFQARIDSIREAVPMFTRHAAALTLDALKLDVRYAVHQLGASPVVTLVAALSLSVGVGVCVGGLTAAHAIFFKPLPVSDPDHLYRVYTSNSISKYGDASLAGYRDIANAGLFDQTAALTELGLIVSGEGMTPMRRGFEVVTPNYFDVLGVRASRGRNISATTDPTLANEVVLTDAFWRHQFNANADIIGKTILVNGLEFTIVGIGPAGFDGTSRNDDARHGWISMNAYTLLYPSSKSFLESRQYGNLSVLARLPKGVDQSAAQSRLSGLARSMSAAYALKGANNRPMDMTILSEPQSRMKPGQRGATFAAIAMFAVLVGIIMLIACVNVAGLLMAKAVARQHEVAVRLTLGASRARLFAQLFTECVVLSILGAAAGCAGTWAVLEAVNRSPDAAALRITPTWHMFAFALLAATMCAFMFGLAPVLQSMRADVQRGLSSTHTANPGAMRMRGRIMSIQVAASLLLLVIAFAVMQGFRNEMLAESGYDPRGVVVVRLTYDQYAVDTAVSRKYVRGVEELIRKMDGVEAAAFTTVRPYANSSIPRGPLTAMPNGELVGGGGWRLAWVDHEYFDAVGLGLVRGRKFNSSDTGDTPPVAIVNETYARGYGVRVGDLMEIGSTGARVIGVARDATYFRSNEPPQPYVYLARAQKMTINPSAALIRVRPGYEREWAEQLKQRIAERFPDMQPPVVLSFRDYLEAEAKPQQVMASAVAGIGAIELALAAVGLYGILLYSVLSRRRELGVRLALGARPKQASWAVLGQSIRAAWWGIGWGLLLSVPVIRLLARGGFGMVGVQLADPLPPFVAIGCAILMVALAGVVPARRAARIDPASALRYE